MTLREKLEKYYTDHVITVKWLHSLVGSSAIVVRKEKSTGDKTIFIAPILGDDDFIDVKRTMEYGAKLKPSDINLLIN